jgi:hypothetical protein
MALRKKFQYNIKIISKILLLFIIIIIILIIITGALTYSEPRTSSLLIFHNIVAYLLHARTAEPQKPRNTQATLELRIGSARCQTTAMET